MTCRELADFISDYLAGELTADAQATFESHLSICPNCVTYLEQFKATIRAGRLACDAAVADESTDAPEALIRAILAARSRS